VGTVSALVAILVWWLANSFHQQIIAPAIDRHFFHQAYDAQQIIAELNDSLRTASDLPHLLELVATRIQTAVKAETVSILLRREADGAFELAYHCVYSHHNRRPYRKELTASLAPDSGVIRHLAVTGQPLDLDDRASRFKLHATKPDSSVFSSDEREVIDLLNVVLLIPILGKVGLVAIFTLGRHLGDLPYSAEDKRLLLSVGAPTTLALENAHLLERMLAEARLREELEAENNARARELEEARQLQLSMLPKQVPRLDSLEIAVYMKTATEVGGDYYDFDLAADGTLTVAVGDATGHGLKAGTVVTAMKSLFRTFASEPEPAVMLKQSSRVLKEMNLRSLFMALTILKFKDRRLKISAAGMPAVLIYRKQAQRVEEVSLPGMPLGSVTSYPYKQVETMVATGDVVVALSDGFPERFNTRGEILGFERAANVLLEIAAGSASEIVARYVADGEEWASGHVQDDDVTFVVLKVKETVEKI
jgi:serine phosphatase RsbU (regulator of sigma subunit)